MQKTVLVINSGFAAAKFHRESLDLPLQINRFYIVA
jgi:hypothetical protein